MAYNLPETKSLDEDAMTNMKGITNLVGSLMILSFVAYAGALFIMNDGTTTLSGLVKKLLSIFAFGTFN